MWVEEKKNTRERPIGSFPFFSFGFYFSSLQINIGAATRLMQSPTIALRIISRPRIAEATA